MLNPTKRHKRRFDWQYAKTRLGHSEHRDACRAGVYGGRNCRGSRAPYAYYKLIELVKPASLKQRVQVCLAVLQWAQV